MDENNETEKTKESGKFVSVNKKRKWVDAKKDTGKLMERKNEHKGQQGGRFAKRSKKNNGKKSSKDLKTGREKKN